MDNNKSIIKTYSSKGMARVKTESIQINTVDSVNLYRTKFGEVEGLPAQQQEGTYYIVSSLVKSALPDRTDLLTPSQQQRNDEGVIIGCLGLDV